MSHRTHRTLLATLLIGACSWTASPAATLPVPSTSLVKEGQFSLLVPEKAMDDRYQPDGSIRAQGTIRGVATLEGTLTNYALRYTFYEANPVYSFAYLVAAEKGACIGNEECAPLVQETRTRDPYTIATQVWPQQEGEPPLHVTLIDRGGRVLKLSWEDPAANGAVTTLVEAMVRSVVIDEAATPAPVSAPASTAPSVT